MRVKKHHTGNQYLSTKEGVWVRNFCEKVTPLDINKLSTQLDYSRFFENEITNEKNTTSLDLSSTKFNNAVIISDGYEFKEKHKVLEKLPNNIAVIATNRSLVKWNINRKIDFFLVNNPYQECMNFMPSHSYYPKCIASTRTYPKFIETYKERGGTVLSYTPTPELGYSSPYKTISLDDYRNPICTSIHLAYKLGVTKLLLMCCDDSFKTERAASIKLENGLWTYPHHLMSHNIINAMLYWYGKNKGIKLGDYSSGPSYEGTPFVESPVDFFNQK